MKKILMKVISKQEKSLGKDFGLGVGIIGELEIGIPGNPTPIQMAMTIACNEDKWLKEFIDIEYEDLP